MPLMPPTAAISKTEPMANTSDISKAGKARQIGWMVNSETNAPCTPSAVYKPGTSAELVMLDINHFSKVVLEAIDRFVIESVADESKRKVFEKRLRSLLCALPFLPNMS